MTQLSRFQAALGATDADAAIISSELNVRYLCGFEYSDGYLLILPHRAYLLADFRYIEAARASVTEFEVLRPEGDMLTEISLLLKINEVEKLIFEDEELSCAALERFREKFKDAELSFGASEILNTQRTVKLDSELELIRAAQRITDDAFEHILGFITPERTELDVALELDFFMKKRGAEDTAFKTIAVSGASSSLPHGVPQSKKLSRGFLTMDFGAKYRGYCSDMTRTVSVGKATDEEKKVYDTVLYAQLTALEKISEGIDCKEADQIARRVIEDAGFGSCFGHSLGHGVGIFIHESPSLSPKAQIGAKIVRGNVVTVEPGIYIEGKFGCRIEDMIAIDHKGNTVNFTKSPKNLIEL